MNERPNLDPSIRDYDNGYLLVALPCTRQGIKDDFTIILHNDQIERNALFNKCTLSPTRLSTRLYFESHAERFHIPIAVFAQGSNGEPLPNVRGVRVVALGYSVAGQGTVKRFARR